MLSCLLHYYIHIIDIFICIVELYEIRMPTQGTQYPDLSSNVFNGGSCCHLLRKIKILKNNNWTGKREKTNEEQHQTHHGRKQNKGKKVIDYTQTLDLGMILTETFWPLSSPFLAMAEQVYPRPTSSPISNLLANFFDKPKLLSNSAASCAAAPLGFVPSCLLNSTAFKSFAGDSGESGRCSGGPGCGSGGWEYPGASLLA